VDNQRINAAAAIGVQLAGFVSSRNAPERRSCSFFDHWNAVPVPYIRHIAAKFRFHLNESDKFALFGSKMPSASGELCPPDPLKLKAFYCRREQICHSHLSET